MKKILLFITIVIFWINLFSSQGESVEIKQIMFQELKGLDYVVVLEDITGHVIVVVIDDQEYYVLYEP